MRYLRVIVGVLFATAVLVTGCRRNPPAAEPTPLPSGPGVLASATDDSDALAREAAARAALEAQREAARIRDVLQARVLFDYNLAAIRDDSRQLLDAKIPILRSDPAIRLRIEGHADERGSNEYNIALGNRRATSVVNYFAGLGIDPARFQTVSFGEERPVARGQDESAWSQNRRAEFVITAGAP
jgi:peptidoglycan-associated lipoprotein